MKKIIVLAFVVICGISNLLAHEIILVMDVSNRAQQDIYSTFITQTGLHKSAPDHYHVTVGWIRNIDPRDASSLTRYMTRKLASYKKVHTRFKVSHADRYLVGGRKFKRCPIVLYPKHDSRSKLEKINRNLARDLKCYKSITGKKYSFFRDVQPGTYTPHITLASTNHILTHHVNQNAAIKKVNSKILRFEKQNGSYRITMR